jgi:hypothetical protein
VSDFLAPPPDDEEENPRSRAMWGLAALAVIAALIVVIVIATSGSGGQHDQRGLYPLATESSLPASNPTASATPTSRTAPTTTPATRVSETPTSKATSAIPTSTANPCRAAAAACPVPGDAGQLIAAVNRFRVSHGRPSVNGAVSVQAQQCALAQGVGPLCAPSYAWEPVTAQNGPKVVSQMVDREHGMQWLLDPAMTSFSVGWAYAGGQYECAILKIR